MVNKVRLGNTDLYCSKVGMGALIIGPSQANLKIKDGSNVIKYALKNGINLIDTAEAYRTYPYIKEAIKDNPNFIISSKSLSEDYDHMMSAIDNGLKELNIKCFDIFFMHELRSNEFERRKEAWNALIDAKKSGKIKYIGVSTHHTDVVRFMADNNDCDVIFALINKYGMGIRTELSEDEINKLDEREINSILTRHRCLDREGTAYEMEEAFKYAKKHNKGTIAMKAFGGGNLVSKYIECLDYIFSKEYIDVLMTGFKTEKEVDDMLNYINNKLPADYVPDTKEKLVRVNKGDCEGCGLCITKCPQNAIKFDIDGLSVIDNTKCITCGYCAQACPNRAIIMY